MIILNYLPKILSLILLWGVVTLIIIYVDPSTIRDVGIEGVYLPLLIAVFIASAYSMFLLSGAWIVGALSALLIVLALLLLIFKVFNAFVAIAIVGAILAMNYFVIHKDSTSR